MDKVYVDDWGQCKGGRFGALRAHVDAGLVTEATIAGELADVVAGTRPGRERDDERILFWHRGLATTDVALGQAILDRAIEQDVGTVLATDDRSRRARRDRAGGTARAARPMIVLTGPAAWTEVPPRVVDREPVAVAPARSPPSRPRARGCSPTSTAAPAPTA